HLFRELLRGGDLPRGCFLLLRRRDRVLQRLEVSQIDHPLSEADRILAPDERLMVRVPAHVITHVPEAARRGARGEHEAGLISVAEGARVTVEADLLAALRRELPERGAVVSSGPVD